MGSSSFIPASCFFFFFVFLLSLSRTSIATRRLHELVQQQTSLLTYHHGPLLSGPISLHLIWYGRFSPSQRAIVSDFLSSLSTPSSSSSPHQPQPSVAQWWSTVHKYYPPSSPAGSHSQPPSLSLSLGPQILDDSYSLGKSLTSDDIIRLASLGGQKNAINVVLTADDVAVEGFCTSRCGTHGSAPGSAISNGTGKRHKFAFIWVGNAEKQCPGMCAWPFHQPVYGPQSPPLVAPNNDVGIDGMVSNLASLLAGTVTNPFGNGFFQGDKDAPLEAASACPGIYGNGAYPGYAGNLLVDGRSGASYNANGVDGRRYLLPALYDPVTSACSTLV
ncbi:hypothetical protein MLD38_034546 [Melastoma candidum]|uniref:Uncharacterized protein n=2 Tax=Melastoma candidum TaxID=119954 RepID=A0ACB9MAU0_9MYRT|nr:hypothetical protein MLD38_034546 [Melastoma candidum]